MKKIGRTKLGNLFPNLSLNVWRRNQNCTKVANITICTSIELFLLNEVIINSLCRLLVTYIGILNCSTKYWSDPYKQLQNRTIPNTSMTNAMNEASGILEQHIRILLQHPSSINICKWINVSNIWILNLLTKDLTGAFGLKSQWKI